MLDSYLALKQELQTSFPSIPCEFLSVPLGGESLQRASANKRFSVFCEQWKPSPKELGQGAGYRLWRVVFRNGFSRSLEQRWMESDANNGLVAVGERLRSVLEGVRVSATSSPLLPDAAYAHSKGELSGAWEERFQEHLRPAQLEPAIQLHSIVLTTTLQEAVPASSSIPLLLTDIAPQLQSHVVAQLPNHELVYLGRVINVTSAVISLSQPVQAELAEGTKLYTSSEFSVEPSLPSNDQSSSNAQHLFTAHRLNGELDLSVSSPQVSEFDRTYAPLLLDEALRLANQTPTARLLTIRNGEAFEEVYSKGTSIERLSGKLYRVRVSGHAMRYADLSQWSTLP